MKNKVLKIATLIATLCVGMVFSSVDVSAAEEEVIDIPAGSVYEDTIINKKIYCPLVSDFSVNYAPGVATVNSFTDNCSEEHDTVMFPGKFIKNGTEYPAVYEIEPFRTISSAGMGVIVTEGATVKSLEDGLAINYIRFDNGSNLQSYDHAFRGWEQLVEVDGFLEAIEPGGNGSIDLGSTFNGCKSLEGISLDFNGRNASFYDTFSGCDKLRTLRISNANVSYINNLAVRDADSYSEMTGVNRYPMDIYFDSITFPDNDKSSYLSSAFNTISGTITFSGCTSGTSDLLNFDEAFKGSKAINLKPALTATYNKECVKESGAYAGANIKVVGAKAYSTRYMFSEATYGIIMLEDLITEDTISASHMFLDTTMVSVRGIDTWKFGEADISGMFKEAVTLYDPESEDPQTDFLEEGIKTDLRSISFARVTNADEMMCFGNEGCIADYSGFDLSGLESLAPVKENVPFYTARVAPQFYRLPYDSVYYQTDEDKETCGGYKLTKVAGASGTVEGDSLLTDSLMTGNRAMIKVINSLSGDASECNVIGGHKLSEYLESGIEYFLDDKCETPAVMNNVLSDGDNITVYVKDDCIEKNVDEDIKYAFSTTTGNIGATFDGHDTPVRMIDYDPVLTIKKCEKPEEFVLTDAAKKKSAGQFYDIGISVTEDGIEKDVKTISRDLSITVPLPADYDRKGVVILHYNNGETEEPEVLSGDVDNDAKTVTFFMNSFSKVAVLYNDSDVETKTITVKWNDNGDYRNRSGIVFDWVANYAGGITDQGTLSYSVRSESETTLSFDVRKMILGASLESVNITYRIKNEIEHKDEWDDATGTLTLTLQNLEEKTNKVVKVDLTDVSDDDFRKYVADATSITLTVNATYEDESVQQFTTSKKLASNFKVYEMTYSLVTVNGEGSPYKTLEYKINMPDGYNMTVDYDTDTILVTKEKDVYGDYTEGYTVTAFMNDNNDESGKRPDEVKIKVKATFGSKEWSQYFSVICRDPRYTGNQMDISVPGTCNGIPRDSLTFEPDPVEGYTITVTKVESDHAWIDYNLDNGGGDTPNPTTYKKEITFTFLNTGYKPSAVIVHLQDSNGGNKIDRPIQIDPFNEVQSHEVDVPTNDTYVITGIDGISDNYKVLWNGLSVIITPNTSTPTPTPTPNPTENKYTQNFSVEINDNDNEDGSRPEKITITVSDGKGSTQDLEIGISSGKRFTKQLQVPDETQWSITKIDGLPDRYKVTISGNSAIADYTPEKISKTINVKFEGDGDNKDNTRPTSVLMFVKNGEVTVTNVTVDSNTNWTANPQLNKYRDGVEAKYTVDCEDVKNYSKSVSDGTITLKFTGTLTQAAQEAEDKKAAEAAKNGSTAEGAESDGTKASGEEEEEEFDMSLESFDWIDYANRYPDLKRAYGYNKQKLYAHYIHYGIAEGRYATFTGKYSTVNEDILAAYFPDDYKYAVMNTSADGSSTTTETTTNTVSENADGTTADTETKTESESSVSENSVSENSTDVAEPTDSGEPEKEVITNEDGTTTEKVTSEDGTVTEITKDADGNIIQTKQYKTSDDRNAMAYVLIMIGALMIIASAYIGTGVLRKRPR